MARKKSGGTVPTALASLARSPRNPLGTPEGGSGGAPQPAKALSVDPNRPATPTRGARSDFQMLGPPLPGVGLGPALTRIKRSKP
jgi:hypothetical protein